jgi:hypothetical protein
MQQTKLADPEDRGDKFLWNVGLNSKYKALNP